MKKKTLLIVIMFLIMLILKNKSYAAIEIKPSPEANANSVLKNTTVSNSYLLCQKMTEKGESLYGSTVLPHLSTNKDWGAVSYLLNSIYGTNTAGKSTGIKININGVDYYSTNGNITGVMNWGVNCYQTGLFSQTSSLIKEYIDNGSESTAKDNVIELEKATLNNSRFVEIIDTKNFTAASTQGMGLMETRSWEWSNWSAAGTVIDKPICIRREIFGYYVSSNYNSIATGEASYNGTFRPVIWNK